MRSAQLANAQSVSLKPPPIEAIVAGVRKQIALVDNATRALRMATKEAPVRTTRYPIARLNASNDERGRQAWIRS